MKNYSSGYAEELQPQDVPEDSKDTLAQYRARHPRIFAAISAFLSPTALICYVFYVAVILLF